MRRMIGVGSALTLLVFVAALVIMLIPQPCAPAAPGGHFYLCFPLNLVEGILFALVAATLAMLVDLVGLIHSVITRRRGYALVLGVGLLAVAPGGVLAVIGILTSAMPDGQPERVECVGRLAGAAGNHHSAAARHRHTAL